MVRLSNVNILGARGWRQNKNTHSIWLPLLISGRFAECLLASGASALTRAYELNIESKIVESGQSVGSFTADEKLELFFMGNTTLFNVSVRGFGEKMLSSQCRMTRCAVSLLIIFEKFTLTENFSEFFILQVFY